MFFIEKKPEKPNIGKIVAISVGVTFAVAAAAYGVYMFCRKYCSLCKCDESFLDDDFDCDGAVNDFFLDFFICFQGALFYCLRCGQA